MTAKIYTADQLTNEAYQQLPQRSGSFLHRLLVHSPAKARFGEQPVSKALDFGIWSHAMILEPERFAQDYARDFDPAAYEKLLVTAADMSAWLKERGLKVSGAKAELVQRILDTGEKVHIEPVECAFFQGAIPGYPEGRVQLVPPKEWDLITAMRHAIMLDEERAKMLAGGFPELSIVTDEFKARPDLITGGQWIVNYKSTLDAEPEKFCRKATDYGYPMRAVMECELFKQAYGEYPVGYAILAQEKDPPYLCKTFVIYDRARGDDQPSAWTYGRQQLGAAVRLYRACRDNDVWPGLGSAEDLSVPDYIMKKAGLM